MGGAVAVWMSRSREWGQLEDRGPGEMDVSKVQMTCTCASACFISLEACAYQGMERREGRKERSTEGKSNERWRGLKGTPAPSTPGPDLTSCKFSPSHANKKASHTSPRGSRGLLSLGISDTFSVPFLWLFALGPTQCLALT